MTDTRIVLTGLCVLAIASAVVFWRGGRLERVVMTITVLCWAAASIGQLATGSPMLPIIICDLVFAAGLLGMLVRYHRPWLYALFAVEACRILLHAVTFNSAHGPSQFYRLSNNVLSTIGLLVLVATALLPKRTEHQEV